MRWLAMAAQGLAGRTAARALAQGAWAEALLIAGEAGRMSTPQQGQAVVRRALSGGIPGVSAGAIRPAPMASGLTTWRGMARLTTEALLLGQAARANEVEPVAVDVALHA